MASCLSRQLIHGTISRTLQTIIAASTAATVITIIQDAANFQQVATVYNKPQSNKNFSLKSWHKTHCKIDRTKHKTISQHSLQTIKPTDVKTYEY